MSQSLSALLASEPGAPRADHTRRLLVAQQLAEAVETVHADGGVIGDLDADHVLVAPDGSVTLPDPAAAAAAVRSPAYTPPELQGSLTGHTKPEAQHDLFALAVLIFQLLMNGKHPYVGHWVGGGTLPEIPKAIQLGLYAYGGSSVAPPPGAPALSTLEPGLADLFKRSFGATSAIFRTRPTGAEWARALAAARSTEAVIPPQPVTDQSVVLLTPVQVPATHVPLPSPLADAAAEAAFRPQPEAAPEVAAPDSALLAQEPWVPVPATSPDLERRPQPGAIAPPVQRRVSRRAIAPRTAPLDDASDEPRQLAQSERSWSSIWRDLTSDLLYELAVWKQAIIVFCAFLLFLVVFVLAESNDYWANPRTRPAAVRATRVPVTQTPLPQPTATRIALVNNPTVASFGSNFDVADRTFSATGERFIAQVHNKALRLEVFGKDARGRAMFDTAPAQGDFNFTVHVGSTSGQGEMLIYLRKPDGGRTWVFAIDPGATTWAVYEEQPWSNHLTTIIAHQDYRDTIGGEPLRTVTVTREGSRTSLLINGTAVSPRVAGRMPRIGMPITVGIGAMIPEDPENYDGESFVVTIDRVSMSADEP